MTNQARHIVSTPAPDISGEVFELHPTPSLLFTRAGVVVRANSAARRHLYAHDTDLSGAAVTSILPALTTPLVGGEPPSWPRTLVRRIDGSHFNGRVRIVAAGADTDAPMLACIEDLSDLEGEIESANKEFEALTSAAGHDLRGPLRILKGFTEALEDECGEMLNEEGRSFLREIVRAGDRMEGLIDGLLAFSRAGRGELSRESLDLSTLIDLVFYELRHTQGERQVDSHIDPGMNAWGDVRLMMTVLRNLIGNAWKFTSRNAAATVRCHVEQRAGRTWICVTDDGAGFDMSLAARLFKPFTRLHRQDEFPGHGMGLATSHRIIRRHGGEIEAESAPGRGTVVRFWLPQPDS